MLNRPSPVTVPGPERGWLQIAEELAREFATTVASDDIDGHLPLGHLRALSASGLDVAFLPVEHGGEGLSYATLGNVVRVLAVAHPAVATVWLMHLGAAHGLVSMSSPDSAAFFAAELRAGKRFANALSEPSGGAFFLMPQQDAVPAADGWTLTGVKEFVSGAEAADHLLLNARIDDEPAFFGVTVDDTVNFPPIDQTMGMRATRSRRVSFDGTPLHRDRRCSAPPPGYTNLITAAFAFLSLGIAESALDTMKSVALKRKTGPGGESVAEVPWVRMEAASAWAELRAASLLAEQTLWLADRRDPEAMLNATEAKMLANEVAKRCAATAVKVAGGGGYLQRSPIQRIFRDAQAGALMAYSVPVSQDLVGGWVLDPGLVG